VRPCVHLPIPPKKKKNRKKILSVVGRREWHVRKLKFKESEPEKCHIEQRMR
jgi:hypothetical protein